MGLIRLRVRGPNGQSTVSIDDAVSIDEFRQLIAEVTSLQHFNVKTGAPPTPLQTLDLETWAPSTSLAATGLSLANSLLTVSVADPPVLVGEPSKPTVDSSVQEGAASAASARQRLLSLQRKQVADSDPPEIVVDEWGMNMVLRVMPDDNSCLFRALGSCILSDDIDSATELRDIVATVIQANSDTYGAAILGMQPADYCRKIKDPDAWGGEIEIAIIADYFGVAVDTINVKDLHIYSYNQSAKRKCIIVYSGIHYDAIAMTGGGAELRQFDASDSILVEKAVEICRILQGRHYYTDTSAFGIECLEPGCGWKGNGERAANEHASITLHTSFGEEGH